MNRLDEPMRGEQTGVGEHAPDGAERVDFWVDTCREATERHQACPAVMEYYQKHGCRFTVPSSQQVQEILAALDSAMPQWEKAHPELFFQTLEINFPELVRRV